VSLLSDLSERLRSLFFRRRQDRDLEAELADHLERDIEERRRQGTDADTARREAVMALGGVAQVKEAVRDARGVRPLDDLTGDIRQALRGLGHNPGFTAAAVLVLGLGLGASTAVFNILERVVLSDLPYPEGGRLVRI
jgi:hypothetical protein